MHESSGSSRASLLLHGLGGCLGIRINKSFKIARGVRIRLGNRSSSRSVGGKAGRVTLNSRGRHTATVRLAPGVSYSSSTGTRPQPSRTAAGAPAASTDRAPLGPLIGPRRNITEGWLAADERGVVVHRSEHDDVRIPWCTSSPQSWTGRSSH
ncbi:DUF4236 domain-containing protein [Streptomyces parvulus]|uniref:DUF4236 domain-containing protein n=1 Tax=Streptomyces parvulus TaxID=146923 RepID=UPI0033AA42CA